VQPSRIPDIQEEISDPIWKLPNIEIGLEVSIADKSIISK
jgi:hypothetical protein